MIAGLIAGVIAGSIAAIVASLVSLPLRSPVDSVFNTATITLASLVVGIVSGLLWAALDGKPRRMLIFDAVLAVAFIVVVAIAAAGNSVLERLASFTIPLAAIVFVLVGVLTPSMRGISPGVSRALAVILLIAAVVLGAALMGQGDTESGELSLPERVESPTPAATQAPTPAPATQPAVETPPDPKSEAADASPVATQPPAPAATKTTETAASMDVADTPQVEQADNTPVQQATAQEGTTGVYLVGEDSEITFTVGEVLARSPARIEAVMRSTDLSGQINIDGEPSTIEVDLHTLSSDQQYRDRYVRSRMFPDDPVASFTVDSVGDLPPEFHSGDEFERPVSGTLSLKGKDFPLTFDLKVRNDGNALNVLGSTVVTWEQLEIPVPTARSVVSIEDDIHVQILLIAAQQ